MNDDCFSIALPTPRHHWTVRHSSLIAEIDALSPDALIERLRLLAADLELPIRPTRYAPGERPGSSGGHSLNATGKKGLVWMPRPMPLFIDLINDISKYVGQ